MSILKLNPDNIRVRSLLIILLMLIFRVSIIGNMVINIINDGIKGYP